MEKAPDDGCVTVLVGLDLRNRYDQFRVIEFDRARFGVDLACILPTCYLTFLIDRHIFPCACFGAFCRVDAGYGNARANADSRVGCAQEREGCDDYVVLQPENVAGIVTHVLRLSQTRPREMSAGRACFVHLILLFITHGGKRHGGWHERFGLVLAQVLPAHR